MTNKRDEAEAAIDWIALAQRFQSIQAHLVHHDTEKRYGDDFYAEALRRTILDPRSPFMTRAEADHLIETHTILSKLTAESAEQRRDELLAENRRVLREARADITHAFREAINDRTMPSKYRREGALQLLDWIDPTTTTSPYNR